MASSYNSAKDSPADDRLKPSAGFRIEDILVHCGKQETNTNPIQYDSSSSSQRFANANSFELFMPPTGGKPTSSSTPTPPIDYFQLMLGSMGKNQMMAAAFAAAAAAASSNPQPARIHSHLNHSPPSAIDLNKSNESQKLVDELVRGSHQSMAAAAAAAIAAANNAAANTSLVMKNSIKLCRRRKARTVFSDQQLSGLEKRFETQKYLSTPERVELANSLGLSETQVMRLRFGCY